MGKSIGLVLLALAAAGAQTPTFSTGTRLVQVDTIVRDSHGPVAGLTRDDFTLLDNGKPQKIAVFSVRSSRNPAEPLTPLPPGAVSNRLNRHGETPASATILLIDRQNTPALDQAYAMNPHARFWVDATSDDGTVSNCELEMPPGNWGETAWSWCEFLQRVLWLDAR